MKRLSGAGVCTCTRTILTRGGSGLTTISVSPGRAMPRMRAAGMMYSLLL